MPLAGLGEVEHRVMSTVKQMIPDSVREAWHTYWQSFRKAEAKALGDDEISDKMEMATWGVEKAQERNRVDASKYQPNAFPLDRRRECPRSLLLLLWG